MKLSLRSSAPRGRFFLLRTTAVFIFTFFVVAVLAPRQQVMGQQAHRIKADYTVKSKTVGRDEAGLITGTVFYDLRIGRLIFDVTFPQKEIWVFIDSVQWIIRNDTLVQIKPSTIQPKLSVLHLSLNQQLNGFGLEQSGYSMTGVKTEDGLLISNWSAPLAARRKMGQIALASRERQLNSVIFYHPDGRILRKQHFRKYQKFLGISIPTEVVDEIFEKDKKIFQATEYKNIVINEQASDFYYRRDPRYRHIPGSTTRTRP